MECGKLDVIVGMDWLSKRKFVIVCHEKVVRIPLEGDEILQNDLSMTNTPATLVPRVLPTKRLTEGERGFEQTKKCYLTEVIPFFKTLKEHFEGIQKALTKEVKEMKDIFEELEAEVDQNVVNRKHDEIHCK
ncbi:hypothetical protein Tco_0963367 [Tanacetum coccineum]